MNDPNNPGDPNHPGAGYPPPPGGYPPQAQQGAAGQGGYPQPGGYPGHAAPSAQSGYPPPGGYAQPGGFPPQPGGHPQAGGYAQLGGYAQPGYAQPMPAFEGERGQLLHAFIGNNAERYLRVFHKLEVSGGQLSWNWSAFFANIFWLAYRKLYVPAGIAAGIMIVMVIIAGTLGTGSFAMLYALSFIFPALLAGAVGMFGDALLKKRADAELGQIQHRYPDPHSRAAAAAATGGTSGAALAIALVGWFAVQAGLYAADLSPYKYFDKNRYQRIYYYR